MANFPLGYFFYEGIKLRGNEKWLQQLHAASVQLYTQLENIDAKTLHISDYSKRYLSEYQNNLRAVFQLNNYLLSFCFTDTKIQPQHCMLLDHGGGIGLLSLLAKAADVGSVIYNDVYDVSCSDAQQLASELNLTADNYVCGDIDAVTTFLQENNLKCNCLASSEVLEHIYDIPLFLSQLKNWMVPNGCMVMSTSANPFNPRVKKRLMALQRRDELAGVKKEFGHKERDAVEPFLSIRKKMIEEKFSAQLTKNEIAELAQRTRGKIQSDIYKTVEQFTATHHFPPAPFHPTNTCDPNTGNWTEHLMNPYELNEILVENGFFSRVSFGYYSTDQSVFSNAIKKMLNRFIAHSWNATRFIAPSYALCARKKD